MVFWQFLLVMYATAGLTMAGVLVWEEFKPSKGPNPYPLRGTDWLLLAAFMAAIVLLWPLLFVAIAAERYFAE